MRPIHFEAAVDGDVRVYRYLPGEHRPVERNWRGLYEYEGPPWPFDEYGANNNNMEEVAVYAGLVWSLTAGLDRFAIPCYYRDRAAELLTRPCELVSWEFDTDATGAIAFEREKGFVGARALVRVHPPPTRWQRDHANEAGLFPVESFGDLIALLRATLPDAQAEVNVFGVGTATDAANLLDVLRGAQAPALVDVLETAPIFIDLTLGVDLGYGDSLTVASRDDIGEQVARVAADATARVASYEARVESIPNDDIDGFFEAMAELSGVPRPEPRYPALTGEPPG